MRYTRKTLNAELEYLNKCLEKLGKDERLEAQGRNGYIGLDTYGKDGRCIRNIATGTAKCCSHEAHRYVTNCIS